MGISFHILGLKPFRSGFVGSHPTSSEWVPYFFDQMLRLLFEGGIHFIGKSVNSNNG